MQWGYSGIDFPPIYYLLNNSAIAWVDKLIISPLYQLGIVFVTIPYVNKLVSIDPDNNIWLWGNVKICLCQTPFDPTDSWRLTFCDVWLFVPHFVDGWRKSSNIIKINSTYGTMCAYMNTRLILFALFDIDLYFR